MHELKKQIRKQIVQKKAQYSLPELKQLSEVLLEKLEQYPDFQHAQYVLLYHSLNDEVQTHEFVEKWKINKQIILPVVTGDTLELRCYTGKQYLQTGAYGIEEPTGKLFTEYDKINLAVIPGVSFDKEGHRLGRGKGYYDRLLPQLKAAYKIGICFSFQLSEQIPNEEHDVKMDCVFTDIDIFNGI